jgi:hypothetical protein
MKEEGGRRKEEAASSQQQAARWAALEYPVPKYSVGKNNISIQRFHDQSARFCSST